MKLNLDCMREILLTMESADYMEDIRQEELIEKLSDKFTENDVNYSVLKLSEAGFIEASFSHFDGAVYIISVDDITYDGHQFLSDIRPKTMWEKTKSISEKLAITSVHGTAQIAHMLIDAFIKAEVTAYLS